MPDFVNLCPLPTHIFPRYPKKQSAVSGRIIWIHSLGNECGVKVENATTNWSGKSNDSRRSYRGHGTGWRNQPHDFYRQRYLYLCP